MASIIDYINASRAEKAREYDLLRTSPKYTDPEQREADWYQEQYGYGIYQNLADSADGAGSPESAVVDALANVELKPELVQQIALARAQAQGDVEGSGPADAIADGIQTVSTAATSAANFLWEANTNIVSSTLNDTIQTVKEFDPTEVGSGIQLMNDLIYAAAPTEVLDTNLYANTTLGQQVALAVEEGDIAAGFGQEATGDSFFVTEDSEVGEAKREAALDYLKLENGDAATPGRIIMEAMGADKDSNIYKFGSGYVDFIGAVANDPLNIVPGVGFVKAGTKAGIGSAGKLDEAFDLAKGLDLTTEVHDAAVKNARAAHSLRRAAESDETLRGVVENATMEAQSVKNIDPTRLGETYRANEVGKRTAPYKTRYEGDMDAADAANARAAQAQDDLAESIIDLDMARQADDIPEEVITELEQAVADNFNRVGIAGEEAQKLTSDFYLSDSALKAQIRNAYEDADIAQAAETATDFMKGVVGLTEKDINMTNAYKMWTGKFLPKNLEIIAGMDNAAHIRNLFSGNVDIRTLRRLRNAQTPDEVAAVLVEGAARGDSAVRARRINRIAKTGKPVNPILDKIDTARAFSQRMSTSSTPKRGVNINDHEEMVRLAESQVLESHKIFTFSTRTMQDTMDAMDDAVSRMVDAVTPADRHRVFTEINEQIITDAVDHRLSKLPANAQTESLRGSLLEKVKEALDYQKNAVYEDQQRTMAARLMNEKAPDGTPLTQILGAEKMENTLTAVNALSEQVAVPDVRRLAKVFKHAIEPDNSEKGYRLTATGKLLQSKETAIEVYDKIFRPALLWGRGSYVMLNALDSATRALAFGYPSGWTRPVDTARVAIHAAANPDSRSGQLLQRIGKAINERGVDDVMGDDLFLSRATKEMQWAADYDSRAYFAQNIGVMSRDIQVEQYGKKWLEEVHTLRRGHKDFVEAWADEVLDTMTNNYYSMRPLIFEADHMARTGTPVKWLTDYADEAGMPLDSADEIRAAAATYFIQGPGKPMWDNYLAAIKEKGPKSKEFKKYIKKNPIDYLFGDSTYGASPSTRLLMGDGEEDIVSLLAAYNQRNNVVAATKGEADMTFTWTSKDGTEFIVDVSDRGSFKKAFSHAVKTVPEEKQPEAARHVTKTQANKGFTESVNGFFHKFLQAVATMEQTTGQVPFMEVAYIEEMIKRIPLLSRRDAQKAAKELQRMAANSGKLKQPKKVRMAMVDLDQAVNSAPKEGVLTYSEVDQAAKVAVSRKREEIFYGIGGRNAAAKRMVLVSPFVQAAVNPFKVFGKAVKERPIIAVRAQRLLEGMESQDSAVIGSILSGADNDKPVIHFNQYGQPVIRAWMPTFGLLRSVGPVDFPEFIDLDAQRLNPITYGELSPGGGPAVQVPFEVAMGIDSVSAKTPQWVRDAVSPIRGQGVAPTPSLFDPLFHYDEMVQRYVPEAQAALLANDPDKYGWDPQGGGLSEGGMNLLQEDAWNYARGMMFSDRAAKSLIRGMISTSETTVDANGNEVLIETLKADYWKKVEESGSTGQAAYEILEQYGSNNVLHLVSGKESMVGGDESIYRWSKENPDAFTAYGTVLGYFSPTDGYSSDYGRMLKDMGEGGAKTNKAIMADANRVMKNAQLAQVDAALLRGDISEEYHEAMTDEIRSVYSDSPQGEIDFNWLNQDLSLVRDALAYNDGELTQQYPAAAAARVYLQERDAIFEDKKKDSSPTKTLKGARNASRRAHLYAVGNTLAAEEPTFKPIWNRLLKKELGE